MSCTKLPLMEISKFLFGVKAKQIESVIERMNESKIPQELTSWETLLAVRLNEDFDAKQNNML